VFAVNLNRLLYGWIGAIKMKEAVNPKRRAEKNEMQQLGIKTKKAYRKWQKKERRRLKEQEAI